MRGWVSQGGWGARGGAEVAWCGREASCQFCLPARLSVCPAVFPNSVRTDTPARTFVAWGMPVNLPACLFGSTFFPLPLCLSPRCSGIAHGDVYAHNVMADEEGHSILCDYGGWDGGGGRAGHSVRLWWVKMGRYRVQARAHQMEAGMHLRGFMGQCDKWLCEEQREAGRQAQAGPPMADVAVGQQWAVSGQSGLGLLCPTHGGAGGAGTALVLFVLAGNFSPTRHTQPACACPPRPLPALPAPPHAPCLLAPARMQAPHASLPQQGGGARGSLPLRLASCAPNCACSPPLPSLLLPSRRRLLPLPQGGSHPL